MDEALIKNNFNTNLFQHKDLTDVIYEVIGLDYISDRETSIVWYKSS